MSNLYNLIKELCPEGVQYKALSEICEFQRGTSITKKDVIDGNVPVIAGGQKPAYYHNVSNRNGETIVVSSSGAYAGFVSYWNIPVFLSDSFSVNPNKSHLTPKFVFYFLKSIQEKIHDTKKGGGVPHVHGSSIANFLIPIPPFPVQEEIVRILDNFMMLSTELSAELSARKKQYEYYSTLLLSFSEDTKWVSLSDIAEIGTGSSNTNEELEVGDYPFFVRSQEVRRKDTYEYDETAIITSGDGVGVGKIFHYIEGKYALHQRAYRIHIIDKNVFPRFFYYYMKNSFLSYIDKNSFHSSVTSIRRPMLNNFPVPIPSIEEQARIISILDRFDTLCNDLTSGLPAEIETRQKQYEYYRDKLLNFKEFEG